MKQTALMILLTLAGTAGTLVIDPFWGVAVYFLFAVLRPQYLWEWSLPADVAWSRYVAVSTLLAIAGYKLGLISSPALREADEEGRPVLSRAHGWVLAFGVWVTLSYLFGPHQHEQMADKIFTDYAKLIAMFLASAWLVRTAGQLWVLFVMMTLTLVYISYEMNYLYLVNGYLAIYRRGFGGLDNNGAALMLAMGVPLCIALWDALRRWYRWMVLAMVPVIIHAVMMSYSRGAMLSLIVTCPLWLLRCRRRVQLGMTFVAVGFMIPVMAGKEIQARFFSIQQTEVDDSANSRRQSWAAAIRIASDYPLFGAGLRGANVLSYKYGADMVGRTIHSQYFQIAADNGWLGLGVYLSVLAMVWLSIRRAVRMLAGREDAEARRAYAVACGVEGAMAVFCFGGLFLSLESFELPWLLLFLGAQLPMVKGVYSPTVEQPIGVDEEAPAAAVGGPVQVGVSDQSAGGEGDRWE
jgi:probable O-glycosylation ligase (exosortase A-associated)